MMIETIVKDADFSISPFVSDVVWKVPLQDVYGYGARVVGMLGNTCIMVTVIEHPRLRKSGKNIRLVGADGVLYSKREVEGILKSITLRELFSRSGVKMSDTISEELHTLGPCVWTVEPKTTRFQVLDAYVDGSSGTYPAYTKIKWTGEKCL
jgi:hypothetical protein